MPIVEVTIDAANTDTFWPARDDHIRGGGFPDVTKHPQISCASTDMADNGDSTAVLTGDLSIRGIAEKVSITSEMRKTGPNPFDPVL